MVYVSCTQKLLDVLYGFQQVKKTKDLRVIAIIQFLTDTIG